MTVSDFRKDPGGTRSGWAVLWVATAALGSAGLALAQDSGAPPNGIARSSEPARITMNFKDTDIAQIAAAVQMVTKKTLIVDPRVRATVTMLSSTPVTPSQMWEMFLSILAVHKFIAVPGAGGTIKILPDAEERYSPGTHDLEDQVSATSDEIVTDVIPIKNVSAVQLQTVLRPLLNTQNGQINATSQANMIIISDHASNVNRIKRIIARIDQVGDADVEVMPMQNASATEVVRVLTSLTQGQAQQDPGVQPLKLVADERSNSVLISGEPGARLRIKALISHLDSPQQSGGDTQVVYLHYADAEKLATNLNKQLSGAAGASAPGGAAGAATPAALDNKNSMIWADLANNALVITAPPKVQRQLKDIIDKLDIRRAEVLIEAIIVDVDLAKSSELGVNWATWEQSNGQTIPGATFLTPVGGASLVDLANAVTNPTAGISSALESGTTVAFGRIAKTGISFAAMLRALRSDTDSNVIAQPSVLTTDQQEATMKAADEVPFVTGQYTNTGSSGGSVSPFQTIQREEVGTILKITPRINEGDAIVLKIDIESSSVIPSPAGAVDITTSKREITDNVLIEDGGIIVIGGLISNEYDHSETRVPFLGSIPVIGELFKDHSATHTKKNLMIFIRPTIIHDTTQMSLETNSKYNFIREEQRQVGADESKLSVPLLPGVKSPVLPPMAAPPPAGSTPPAPITDLDRARAAEKSRRARDAAARNADTAGATVSPAPTPPAASPAPPLQAPDTK